MKDETATVESRIRTLLENEHGVDEMTSSEKLTDVGLDSLDVAEFWLNVENEFNLSETDPDVEDECQALQQIIANVERRAR